jgi:hypothetical protein
MQVAVHIRFKPQNLNPMVVFIWLAFAESIVSFVIVTFPQRILSLMNQFVGKETTCTRSHLALGKPRFASDRNCTLKMLRSRKRTKTDGYE